MATHTIGAVVILYRPQIEVLLAGLKSLSPQVSTVCIIDNTPETDISDRFAEFENVKYIPLKENRGIAAAQNIGIKYLFELNYDFVLFSDQDSIAPENLIQNLLTDFLLLKEHNYKIGLIGPVPINFRTGAVYDKSNNYIDEFVINNNQYIETQSILSSYSLVPLQHFKDIGIFLEPLFIDFVEIEWCFRLKSMLGLSSFKSKRLCIQHELGESKRFLGQNISISSPFRLYFQIRNYFWVRKLPYTPASWKIHILKKLILKLIYYPIFPSNRVEYIKSIWKGLKDGRHNQLIHSND